MVVSLGLACSSSKNEPKDEADPKPSAPAPAAPDHGTWEAFWPDFQKAALAKDRAALRTVTYIGGEIDEALFEELVTVFLNDEMLGVIERADAGEVGVTEGTPGGDDELREINFTSATTRDGGDVEFAVFFYFKKIDGKYKLFRILAAG